MSSGHSNVETEIKLSVTDAGEALARIERLGFVLSRARTLEQNVVLDTGDQGLRRSQCLLRLRTAGTEARATYKGPAAGGRHKSREEVEFGVSSFDEALKLFQRLGYYPVFRYEKYRSEFQKPGETGVVMLDETPIGIFIEVEGQAEWIDATAAELGYTAAAYITSSYGTLYFEHCSRQGIAPSHMLFDAS